MNSPSHPNNLPTSTLWGSDNPVIPHPHLGWAILWVVFLLVAQTVIVMVVALLYLAVLSPANVEKLLVENQANMVLVATLATFVTAVLVVGVLYRRHASRRIGLRGMTLWHCILVVLSVLPVQILASEVTNWASTILPSWNLDLGDIIGPMNLGLTFVAVCLLPGIGEEIFFRGFLSRGLIAHHGVWCGSLMTALLFGLVHGDPVQIAGTFVLGVYLQLIFLTTRSLLGPMLLHVLNNLLALLTYRAADMLPLPGLNTHGLEGEVAFVPVPVLMLAGVCTGLLVVLLIQTRSVWILPDGARWMSGYGTAEIPPNAVDAQMKSARTSRVPYLLFMGIAYITLVLTLFRFAQGFI